MTKLINRLKYYGVGFLLGMIFVFFFFKNRGCTWLPENRVKNTILGKVIALPENEKIQLKNAGITDSVFLALLDDGDILFDQSLKDAEVFPKVYVLEKEVNGKIIRGQFSLYSDAFICVAEFLDENEKAKRHTNYLGKAGLIHFPAVDDFVFLETDLVNCKAGESQKKLHKNVLNALKAFGEINLDQSNLMANKAEQQLYFKGKEGEQYTGKSIWFKSKINFKTLKDSTNKTVKLPCNFK